jgi:hypothetical protein
MKKALITALLVVSAAFAPCFGSALDIPNRAADLACAVANPLFWHLWDELLTRELSQLTASPAHEAPVWRNDVFVCLFFQAFLNRAFDGSLTAAQKTDHLVVSIPQHLIRRTIERGFTLAHRNSTQGFTKQQHTSGKQGENTCAS